MQVKNTKTQAPSSNKSIRILYGICAVVIGPIMGILFIGPLQMVFPVSSQALYFALIGLSIVLSIVLLYLILLKAFDYGWRIIQDSNPGLNFLKLIGILLLGFLPILASLMIYNSFKDTHPKFAYQNDKQVSQFMTELEQKDYTAASTRFCDNTTGLTAEKLADIADYSLTVELPNGEVVAVFPMSRYNTEKLTVRRENGKLVTISTSSQTSEKLDAKARLKVITRGNSADSCISYVNFTVNQIIKVEIGQTKLR